MTKKILSILMVCALVVCMCVPAFAAEPAVPYATVYQPYRIGSDAHGWHYLHGDSDNDQVNMRAFSNEKWTIGRYGDTIKLYLDRTIGSQNQKVLTSDSSGNAVTLSSESTSKSRTSIEFYTIKHLDNHHDLVHISFPGLSKDLRAESTTKVRTAPYKPNDSAQQWKIEW